jgi:O-antigen biosynthesis protein
VTFAATSDALISVVIVVHNRLDLTHACLESLRRTARPFELCVVDNGSSDETPSYFKRWSGESPLRYQRNAENLGLIRALNQGAALARGEQICFLHNDTEMLDPHWLGKLATAVGPGRPVGLAGLYGARYVRRDGTYLGRSIVHCLAEAPTMRAPAVEVAVVDGVCLFVPRLLLAELGGFDESYGFFHGYDRDLSFAVRASGRRCVVVRSHFVHRGGGTRTGPQAPLSAETDLAQRHEAMARFVKKWQHALPADARGIRERLTDRLRPLLTRTPLIGSRMRPRA